MLIGKHLQKTREAFTGQWRFRASSRFEKKSVFGQNPQRQVDWLFKTALGAINAGQWILDGGCGTGHMARATAEKHPDANVIALDFNDTIFDVAENSRDHPNLHFIQADITHPPIRPTSLSALYSIGVLHCTPDTRTAFDAVAKLLKPSGRLAVWLYPDPTESEFFRRYYLVRDKHFLGLGHKIPARLRLSLVYIYTTIMLPYVAYMMASGQKEIGKMGAFYGHPQEGRNLFDYYRSAVFSLYDNIAPENQFRHKIDEVLDWYREPGFKDLGTDRYGAYWGTLPAKN
jgi:ubiquinone/menaquinone biosynthesis C-methylase UbiE